MYKPKQTTQEQILSLIEEKENQEVVYLDDLKAILL